MDNGLSIKKAFEECQELERQSALVWEKLANGLVTRIPERLLPFARQIAWLKNSDEDQLWYFPVFLNKLVTKTRKNRWVEKKISITTLERYGFKHFQDLEEGFTELAEVWSGLVIIEVTIHPKRMALVHFQAAEIFPALPED